MRRGWLQPCTHERGHFILVLAGVYRSTARGADQLLGPGELLWNPPGTRHQDCFTSPRGQLLTFSVVGLSDGPARRLLGLAPRLGASLSQRAVALDLGGLLDTEALCLNLCALTAAQVPADMGLRGAPPWLRRLSNVCWSATYVHPPSDNVMPEWRFSR